MDRNQFIANLIVLLLDVEVQCKRVTKSRVHYHCPSSLLSADDTEEQRMLAFNILSCFWMLCILIFGSMFIIQRVPRLPNVIWNLISYGKARNMPGERQRKHSLLDKWLDVPKRWFTHFYAVSVVYNGFLLFKLLEVLFYKGQIPDWYLDILKLLTDFPLETPKASHLSVIIAIALLLIQGARRLYESLLISSYSNSTIHVAHYILGMVFYTLGGITILAEGPDFQAAAPFKNVWQLAWQLEWFSVVGVIVFLWATYHHHIAHKILAGLRKGDKDCSHRIPRGDWFELVSCPHYLAEILIYGAIVIVLGLHHSLSYLLFTFTLFNQVFAGFTVHKWYRQKFDNYPKSRKAVIPWIL